MLKVCRAVLNRILLVTPSYIIHIIPYAVPEYYYLASGFSYFSPSVTKIKIKNYASLVKVHQPRLSLESVRMRPQSLYRHYKFKTIPKKTILRHRCH